MCGSGPPHPEFLACCPWRLPASPVSLAPGVLHPRQELGPAGPRGSPEEGRSTPHGRQDSTAATVQVSLGTPKLAAHSEPRLSPLRSGADGSGMRLSRGPSGTAGRQGHSRGTWSPAFCWQHHQYSHARKGSVLSNHPAQGWATPSTRPRWVWTPEHSSLLAHHWPYSQPHSHSAGNSTQG